MSQPLHFHPSEGFAARAEAATADPALRRGFRGAMDFLQAKRSAQFPDADELQQRMQRRDASLQGITSVLHLGACSATTERDAAYLMRNNYEYTKDVCLWALAGGVRCVYASSAATYGDGERGMSDGADLATLRPLNMYGYSKHLLDLWAARQGCLSRLVGVKYFNIYGPNEDHKGEMRSLVHKAYSQIQATGRMQLFESHRSDYALASKCATSCM